MLKKTVYGLAITAVIFSLILVSACRHSSPEKRMQWMMTKFSKDLKLDKSQQENLDVFKTEMVIKGRELRVAYANVMEEMSLQLRSDEFDKEQVEDAINKISVPQDEFISLFIEKLAEFHGSLTPEQKTLLAKKLDKMKKYVKSHSRYGMHK